MFRESNVHNLPNKHPQSVPLALNLRVVGLRYINVALNRSNVVIELLHARPDFAGLHFHIPHNHLQLEEMLVETICQRIIVSIFVHFGKTDLLSELLGSTTKGFG